MWPTAQYYLGGKLDTSKHPKLGKRGKYMKATLAQGSKWVGAPRGAPLELMYVRQFLPDYLVTKTAKTEL
jgi:hypothetical protein